MGSFEYDDSKFPLVRVRLEGVLKERPKPDRKTSHLCMSVMQLHIIVATLEGCRFAELNDPTRMARALDESVAAGDFTMLHRHVHRFEPQGVTGAAILSESHLALHSWPEEGVLFVDIATCSTAAATEAAFARLCEIFAHVAVKRQTVGYRGPGPVPWAHPGAACEAKGLLI